MNTLEGTAAYQTQVLLRRSQFRISSRLASNITKSVIWPSKKSPITDDIKGKIFTHKLDLQN